MFDRKYYVLCDYNCKFEGMTKEQILTAISQAVETGEIKDVDTGFVQTIKTINGVGLKFFIGTQAEYEVLTEDEKQNLFAIITNDTTKESIESILAEHETEMNSLAESVSGLSESLSGILSAGLLKGGIQKDDFEFINENGGWTIPEGYDPCGNYYSYTSATIRTMYGSGSETIHGWILRGFHIVDDYYLQLLLTADKIFVRTGSKSSSGERTFSTWLQIAGDAITVANALNATSAMSASYAEQSALLTAGSWLTLASSATKGTMANHQGLESGGVYLISWQESSGGNVKTGIANLSTGYTTIDAFNVGSVSNGVADINHYTIGVTPTYVILGSDSEIDTIKNIKAKRIA